MIADTLWQGIGHHYVGDLSTATDYLDTAVAYGWYRRRESLGDSE